MRRWAEQNLYFGGVQAVARNPATGGLSGGGDPLAAARPGSCRKRPVGEHSSPRANAYLTIHPVSPTPDRQEGFGRNLYVRYAEVVSTYVKSIVGERDEADDVTQRVFLMPPRAISGYESGGLPFEGWLLRVALRCALVALTVLCAFLTYLAVGAQAGPKRPSWLAPSASWGHSAVPVLPARTGPMAGAAARPAAGGHVSLKAGSAQSAFGSISSSAAGGLRKRADLVVRTASSARPSVEPGGRLSVTDAVKNNGRRKGGASRTGFYLSLDSRRGTDDFALRGWRSVKALSPRKRSSGTSAVTVPVRVAPGSYHLVACADDRSMVRESNERNNCRLARARVVVQRAPPLPPPPGQPPLDDDPPAPPPEAPRIDGHPLALTRATDARLAFSSVGDGLTFRCQLDGGAFVHCESPQYYPGPLAEGVHVFSVVARDRTGQESPAGSFGWRIDTTPPPAPTLTGIPTALTRERDAELSFSGAEPELAFRCRLDGAPANSCQSPHRLAGLTDGDHAFEVRAVDGAGNASDGASTTWRVDTTPPAAPRIDARPDEETRLTSARFAFSSDEPGVRFACRVDGGRGEQCASPKDLLSLSSGEHTFQVWAVDAAGNEGEAASYRWRVDPSAPPRLRAPRVDDTVATSLADSTRFLYTGDDPVQTGIGLDTIRPDRAAVLRGSVEDRSGQPLPNVAIRVLGHHEFGETRTQADGRFDLAVNGGGPLTLEYEKAGYLGSQRQVEVPWQDYVAVDDVVMLEVDDRVSTIEADSTADFQVARGSQVSDLDGERQNTLLFAKGTTAEMRLPDGSLRPLGDLHVRATEYTVGDGGPAAMPGELPPTSGYTYAVELSIDEATRADATEVRFSQPVFNYVENFLDFPVGTPVPTGYYDRARGRWVASKNGQVVKLLAESGGLAELDTDGDGNADGHDELAALGVTDVERERLAALYEPGQSLWRVPVEHFSAWDYNWGFGPPSDATAPNVPDPEPDAPPDCQNEQQGSVIGCEGQTLGETADITGTPFRLRYQSDRTPGRAAARQLRIPLTGSRVPAKVRQVELEVSVAGRRFRQGFAPSPNQTHLFMWDGKDAYGRTVQGRQRVTVGVGYTYEGVRYTRPVSCGGNCAVALPAFALASGVPVTGERFRGELTLWKQWRGELGAWDARGQGLGGWSLDAHHAYDPTDRTLYLGDGRRRSADAMSDKIERFAGSGEHGDSGDGGPATRARVASPVDGDIGSDGAVFFADRGAHRVRRVDPDGTISTVAGTGERGFGGDDGAAAEARLDGPEDVAVASDGALYIADSQNHRIRRVAPDGVITTVAGTGEAGYSGDGGPAREAQLSTPSRLDVAPDGSVYFSEGGDCGRLRRVGADGLIATVANAGRRCSGSLQGGIPATEAGLARPEGVAVGLDGSVYVADNDRRGGIVWRVGTDGIIRRVAGSISGQYAEGIPATDAQLSSPSGLDVGADGSVYVAERFGGDAPRSGSIRRVAPDGTITRVAGSGAFCLQDPTPPRPFLRCGDGGAALQAALRGPEGVMVGPDGSIVIVDGTFRLRRVERPLPDYSPGEIRIASGDASQVFVFSSAGRHLRTIDALTGALRHRFAYDAAGRLGMVDDGDGNATKVERDAGGNATALVAPGGQRTELAVNAHGYLSKVANPAGEATQLDYTADGLLTSVTDPKGGVHRFSYDDLGRLTRDEDPAGGSKTLSRTDTANGYKVAVRTALGRTTTYELVRLPTGDVRRTITDPSGARTEAVVGKDARTSVTAPDGTTLSQELGPDPRFGMQAPIVAKQVRKTPGGLTQTTTGERTATLNSGGDLQELTERISVNGQTTTTTYDAATRTVTATSPAGRKVVTALDAKGRSARIEPAPGVEAISYSYDDHGRRSAERQGGQTLSYAYDARDRLASVTDANGGKVEYGYDQADRVIALKLPSGKTYGFAYDPNGNRTEVKMPNGEVHRLDYTPVDLNRGYTPPGGQSLTRSYDRDRNLTKTSPSSVRATDLVYDIGGRLTEASYDEATIARAYADGTDRLKSITRTATGGGAQHESAFAYDGDLLTAVASTGTAEGRFDYRYDHTFLLAGVTLTSGPDTIDTAFERDPDGFLTKIGPFAVKRQGPAGMPTDLGDGTLTIAVDYDPLGRASERSHRVAGNEAYKLKVSRDNVGRITQKQETVAGEQHTYDYTYDPDGQLTGVDRDGQATERYVHDDNGNRTSRRIGQQPVETATYDAQDRLTKSGAVEYAFGPDGTLSKRGSDTFRYSAEGELLEANVGGRTVTYTYDGHRRRVSRTDDSGTTQYLYGNPNEPFQVTAVRFPSGQLSTLYYDEDGLVVALQRGSDRYYVATDQVGTPRVATDAEGSVVKTFEYDSFGNKVSESGDASFRLPIGFAGGLADEVTGLVRFGFRDYDPEAGRWTARDPVLFAGGQGNLYAYAGDDPVNNRDPSGLDPDLILTLPDGARVLGTYRPGSPAWYAGDNIWIPAQAEGWVLSDGSFLPFDPSLKTEKATKLDVIKDQLTAIPGKVYGACIRVLSGSDAKFRVSGPRTGAPRG